MSTQRHSRNAAHLGIRIRITWRQHPRALPFFCSRILQQTWRQQLIIVVSTSRQESRYLGRVLHQFLQPLLLLRWG